jgi:hypothetical protein
VHVEKFSGLNAVRDARDYYKQAMVHHATLEAEILDMTGGTMRSMMEVTLSTKEQAEKHIAALRGFQFPSLDEVLDAPEAQVQPVPEDPRPWSEWDDEPF